MDNSNKRGDEAAIEGRNYIRWDAEGVEKIPPHEEEDIKAVAEQVNGIQRRLYNQHRHAFGGKPIPGHTCCARSVNCFQGTHARTQGVVKGKLIVQNDLPKHLKQTLFDHGAEYPVLCRYSSEPGDAGLDVKCRGLKVLAKANRKLGPYPPTARFCDESLQC